MAQKSPGVTEGRALRPLPSLMFAGRWLQLPLYLGLIVAQAIYEKAIIAQVGIPITFLLSAMAVAAADRIIPQAPHA